MRTPIIDGRSIEQFIPANLRGMFYNHPLPAYKYAIHNGKDPYGFPANGLVFYAPLWAIKNNVAFKSVDAYRHPCTKTNAPWSPSGSAFSGTGKIVVPDHATFNITTTLTVLQWVKVTNILAIAHSFTNKYVATTANREWNFCKHTNTGKLEIFFGDPVNGTYEGDQLTDAAHLVNNIWGLVGFTFNAGTPIIYFNGAAVASSLSDGAIPASLFNGSANVQLGAQESAQYLVGSEGDSWIYNRVLTPSEILNVYNCTKWRY